MSWNSFDTRDVQSITRINTNIRVDELEAKFESRCAITSSELDKTNQLLQKLIAHYERTVARMERELRNMESTITQLQQKNEEVDECLETLWYAPGGPAAAALIVQYDHHRENAK